MKKVYTILLLTLIMCVACQFKLSPDDDADKVHTMKVERYDQLEYRYLATGDFSALQEMNTEYPIETRTLIEDVVKIGDATDPDINSKFLRFYQDTTLQTLISSVESEYSNMDDINRGLNTAFTKMKKFLPDMEIPRIYSQISALDQSIVVGNGSIGISLDKYLGANYPLYARFYTQQQRQQMTRDYILPDCISFYLMSNFPLDNFEGRPQRERDLHLAKIQWIANQVMGSNFYHSKYINAIANYMRHHSKTSYEELLKITDFSDFKE